MRLLNRTSAPATLCVVGFVINLIACDGETVSSARGEDTPQATPKVELMAEFDAKIDATVTVEDLNVTATLVSPPADPPTTATLCVPVTPEAFRAFITLDHDSMPDLCRHGMDPTVEHTISVRAVNGYVRSAETITVFVGMLTAGETTTVPVVFTPITPTEPTPDTTATLQVETLANDGAIIPFLVELDGERMIVDTKNGLDPTTEHQLSFGEIPGYSVELSAPNGEMTLPVGTLIAGRVTTITVVYMRLPEPPAPEEPEELATLCVPVIPENLPRIITLDGELMPDICRYGVDHTMEHRIGNGGVAGYERPGVSFVRIGMLSPGRVTTIPVVYTPLPPPPPQTLYVRAEDDFGNLVPAEIHHITPDGYEDIRVGEWRGEVEVGEFFTTDALPGYEQVVYALFVREELIGTTVTLLYRLVNAAEVCFEFRNEVGQEVRWGEIVGYANSIPMTGPCVAINRLEDSRFMFTTNTGANILAPLPYFVAADALAENERKSVTRLVRVNSRQYRKVCSRGFPEAEGVENMFEDQYGQRSMGWSLSWEEMACEFAEVDAEGSAITNISHIPEAAIHSYTDSFGREFWFGLYEPDQYALVCAEALTPWGTWADNARIVVNGDVYVQNWWGNTACAVFDPAEDLVISCQTPEEEDRRWVAPPDEVIPAGHVTPGHMTVVQCSYVEVQRPDPYSQGEVIVTGPEIGTEPGMEIRMRYTLVGGGRYDDNTRHPSENIYFWMNTEDPEPITITFLDEGFLAADDPLVIDQTDPAASGAVFDMAKNRWVWRVSYSATEPFLVACVASENHNGEPISGEWWVSMDGMEQRAGTMMLNASCWYAATASAHIFTSRWTDGFMPPRPIYVPAGFLEENRAHMFTMTHVPNGFAAEMCITTPPVQAEIMVNDGSVGWNPVVGEASCVWVDVTKTVDLSTGPVLGWRHPPAALYPAHTWSPRDYVEIERAYEPITQ